VAKLKIQKAIAQNPRPQIERWRSTIILGIRATLALGIIITLCWERHLIISAILPSIKSQEWVIQPIMLISLILVIILPERLIWNALQILIPGRPIDEYSPLGIPKHELAPIPSRNHRPRNRMS
jgi:ABC-type transport system involved in multi-copper enzyme maturation permease subunit